MIDKMILLAPLAGITDAPYRRLAKEQGADFVYTEMISGKGIYYKDKRTDELLRIFDDEKPIGIQLFGREPDILAHAVHELDDREHVSYDLNIGCPVPKIVKNGEGSALLKHVDLAAACVEAMVKESKACALKRSGNRGACGANGERGASCESRPVSVKMRIGFDHEHIIAREFALAMEAAGASSITVHGRTREQYYSGKASWTEIAEVKQALKIPVYGNGDIFTGMDALRMLEETGADGVMVARGSMGNPWIFKEIKAALSGASEEEQIACRPSLREKGEMFARQFQMTCELKGEHVAVREMRKHAAWYFKGYHGASRLKDKVNHIDSMSYFLREIDRFCEQSK
ncbi:MAG: tRNA dihydrouridine synthase DusB [Clostridiales Family XIII bacterium]|jgi:tRNA-dihydrouridine synthase B|nr:tRNA dihydrouridine synthase DusB [Clostridiales Family XIII bacterium]